MERGPPPETEAHPPLTDALIEHFQTLARYNRLANARLDTTPEEILEAVRRGWLPEQVEGVESKYALEGNPPELVGVEPWVDAAIEKRAKAKARAKVTGDTAMSAAYQKAKRRAA